MASISDKAKEARYKANKVETYINAQDTVSRNAKAAKVDMYDSEYNKAVKVIAQRSKAERERTASRAEFAAKRDAVNSAKARMVAGITGAGASKVNKVYRNIGNK